MIEIVISSLFALVALASMAGIIFIMFKPNWHPGVSMP